MEYRNVREIFPGIGCAWTNADGKATAEYYGVVDRESNTPVNRDTLISRGWGENGQCMLKMHCRTGEIAVVMTNRNPGVDQQASGVERLADRKLI